MSRKKIAVLIASIDREYQQDFAAGLASAGAQFDVDICIFNSQGHMNIDISMNETGESMIYDLPDLRDFDGIISLPATMGNEVSQKKVHDVLRLIEGKPHVSIDEPFENAVSITFDDRVSVQEMAEHLINEHGARKIAFVSGPLNSNVALERVKACRCAMEKFGLELNEKDVFDGEWTRIGGRRAAEEILRRGGELPDAVMCGNDDMALSVIECFSEHGIHVPHDVAVTGFDALREAVIRGLTTICRPVDRAARKAVEILSKWFNGEKPEDDKVILSTIPIYGETCGCIHEQEHSNEKLRALGTERWHMETILTRVSMFSGSMASVGDEEEAAEKISDFMKSWDIRELYLCVNPSLCRNTDSETGGSKYPDRMLLLYGERNGRKYPRETFMTFDLTPVLQEMRKNAVCLLFCPLYYRDQNFGYVAMEMGSATGSALYSVLMLLNSAVMSLYLQTNFRNYTQTIQRMAVHDIMTGMLNRRGYSEQAPEEFRRAGEKGRIFAILSVDMNGMKMINDKYGHMAGDEAICRMGRVLEVLTKHGMTPVHISGDEFLAYGTVPSMDEAERLPGYIRGELERINNEDPWICRISASIGVFADVPKDGADIDSFQINADRAMYADKNKLKYGRRKDDIITQNNGPEK